VQVREPVVGEADEGDGALVDVAAVTPGHPGGHGHDLRGLRVEHGARDEDRRHAEVVHGAGAEAAL